MGLAVPKPVPSRSRRPPSSPRCLRWWMGTAERSGEHHPGTPGIAVLAKPAVPNSAVPSRCQGGTRAHTHTLLSLAHGAQLSSCWHKSFPRLSRQKPPARLGGGWGAREQGQLLPLLPSPIVCDLPPVLMSYLGCIFFVIAKQWQKRG